VKKWTIALSMLVIVGIISFGVALASVTVHQMNAVSGAGCGDEWVWILNQLASSSDAPATITVYFSGGGSTSVGQCQVNNHNVHYCLAAGDVPAGETVVDATAVVPGSWSGKFVLSDRVCAPSPSPSPSPSPTPAPSPSPSPAPSPSPSPGL